MNRKLITLLMAGQVLINLALAFSRQIVMGWACFLCITDGYPVYPCVIEDGDPLVSKTAMTRVEGENCRLRHYLARLHRKTLCYSKAVEMLTASVRLLIYYLKHHRIPVWT
jgi:insertion element IS1 protein InsB